MNLVTLCNEGGVSGTGRQRAKKRGRPLELREPLSEPYWGWSCKGSKAGPRSWTNAGIRAGMKRKG